MALPLESQSNEPSPETFCFVTAANATSAENPINQPDEPYSPCNPQTELEIFACNLLGLNFRGGRDSFSHERQEMNATSSHRKLSEESKDEIDLILHEKSKKKTDCGRFWTPFLPLSERDVTTDRQNDIPIKRVSNLGENVDTRDDTPLEFPTISVENMREDNCRINEINVDDSLESVFPTLPPFPVETHEAFTSTLDFLEKEGDSDCWEEIFLQTEETIQSLNIEKSTFFTSQEYFLNLSLSSSEGISSADETGIMENPPVETLNLGTDNTKTERESLQSEEEKRENNAEAVVEIISEKTTGKCGEQGIECKDQKEGEDDVAKLINVSLETTATEVIASSPPPVEKVQTRSEERTGDEGEEGEETTELPKLNFFDFFRTMTEGNPKPKNKKLSSNSPPLCRLPESPRLEENSKKRKHSPSDNFPGPSQKSHAERSNERVISVDDVDIDLRERFLKTWKRKIETQMEELATSSAGLNIS